ncbi:hypothetical protein PVK06_005457 [Gossypium arboreum]|uniref:Uncharacterized protein n=1 Tax=Gossypium arboreum TaxID=29729 RepID=A0ABR0QV37_GOSAR|nr:hypothetical protein PVK06_005457 [Gossypium arboreum]
MENDLAQLSINDEEYKVFQIQPDPNREERGEIFRLTRRALAMSSIWLREDGEGKLGDDGGCFEGGGIGYWRMENKRRCVDLVLGFNLEGGSSGSNQRVVDVLLKQSYDSMEHDLEDPTLLGEEGKKISRIKFDNSIENYDNKKQTQREDGERLQIEDEWARTREQLRVARFDIFGNGYLFKRACWDVKGLVKH